MNSKDKGSLIVLSVIFILIVSIVVPIIFTVKMKYSHVALLVLGFYHIVVMTFICIKYYKFYKQPVTVINYIPLVNQVILFPKLISSIILLSIGLLLALFLVTKIPYESWGSIVGIDSVPALYGTLTTIGIIMIGVVEIVYGFATCRLFQEVYKINKKVSPIKTKVGNNYIPLIILCYIPLIRVITAIKIVDYLNTCVTINGYDVSVSNKETTRLEKGNI